MLCFVELFRSLSPLFDNPKLDRELRTMIRENFLEFCSSVEGEYFSAEFSVDIMKIVLFGLKSLTLAVIVDLTV